MRNDATERSVLQALPLQACWLAGWLAGWRLLQRLGKL
jgi:hypothetical protein